MSVRGSCLCGAVAYEITGVPTGIYHCHCSRCRKVRGTAHSCNMAVPIDGLHYERGAELLSRFKPKDAMRFTHVFCRVCGSSMPFIDPSRGWAVVPMGSLDDAPPACPRRHIYVGSKASWETITDDLPQDDAGPTG